MQMFLTAFWFEQNENVRDIVRCANEGILAVMTQKKWPVQDADQFESNPNPFTFVFTDDLEMVCRQEESVTSAISPLVFFISDRREDQEIARKLRTVVLTDGLDHMPGQVAAAIVDRFALLGKPAPSERQTTASHPVEML